VKSRFVIGRGAMLDIAVGTWTAAQSDAPPARVEIGQGADYGFDWSALDAVDRDAEVFMAFGETFGNFSRLDLFQAAIERGFHMPALVSPRAMVAAGVKIGPNCYIGDGAVIGAGTTVEYNCVVNDGALIGAGVRVKPSCWIGPGVQLGNNVEIGMHSTLREGVIVAPGTKIGRNCEIGIAGVYREDLAPKTVYDPRYDGPILVYGG
jgi:acetyltransferase-like isoleucine patch superfamily enzyme